MLLLARCLRTALQPHAQIGPTLQRAKLRCLARAHSSLFLAVGGMLAISKLTLNLIPCVRFAAAARLKKIFYNTLPLYKARYFWERPSRSRSALSKGTARCLVLESDCRQRGCLHGRLSYVPGQTMPSAYLRKLTLAARPLPAAACRRPELDATPG
jgi:hypothetical protein